MFFTLTLAYDHRLALTLQDLAEMPAEERRLAEEEGSFSKKTWLLKKEDIR